MSLKKRMAMFVLVIIVLGTLVVAQDEKVNDCSGFFSSIGCLFDKFTGREDALVGEAVDSTLNDNFLAELNGKKYYFYNNEIYFDNGNIARDDFGTELKLLRKSDNSAYTRIYNDLKNKIEFQTFDTVDVTKTVKEVEAEKREAEQKRIEKEESEIIREILTRESISKQKDEVWTKNGIKDATNCFHTPKCEGFKLSDNDAATLYEGLAVYYENTANSLIHTQQDFANSFDNKADGWQATIGGKTYIYSNNIWTNEKDAKDTKDDDQIKRDAQSIQSPSHANAKKRAEAAREEANTASNKQRWWQGVGAEDYAIIQGKQAVGEVFGGIMAFAGELSQYRSLSNAIFPDTQWVKIAESEFVERLAALESPVASGYGAQFCGIDDNKRAESPGQSTAFFRTASGTYQFVGALQVEKSPRQSFILCERNPDEESDQEFICPEDFICKNDEFCYKNEEDEEPVKGRFYKINWRVTAPQDEKFTPFIDENGVAVAFNIFLEGAGKSLPVYKRGDYVIGDDVIQLNNGDTDGAVIAKYRPEDFTIACIRFSKGVKSSVGDNINEICSEIKEIEKGEIEYADSERLPSITTASPGVTLNI